MLVFKYPLLRGHGKVTNLKLPVGAKIPDSFSTFSKVFQTNAQVSSK